MGKLKIGWCGFLNKIFGFDGIENENVDVKKFGNENVDFG